MHKDREVKRPNGTYLHLEKPEYGIMIKDGIVVNQEQYDLFLERKKQNALAPTATPPELAEKTKKEIESFENKKIDELETKMNEKIDGINNKLDMVLDKILNNGKED